MLHFFAGLNLHDMNSMIIDEYYIYWRYKMKIYLLPYYADLDIGCLNTIEFYNVIIIINIYFLK